MNVTNYLNSMQLNPIQQPIKQELDQDAFLQLFVKQLQLQDPMDPMDSKESAVQLAQFTQVEKLTKLDDTLTKTFQQMLQNSVMGATSAIGKDVVAGGYSISKEGGSVSQLTYDIPETAEKVSIHIYDADKHVIRTVDAGSKKEGTYTFTWDGNDENGKLLEDGTYTVAIEARDANDELIRTTSKVSGTVSGVTVSNGNVVLKLSDGREVLYNNVIEIQNPPAPQEGNA